MDDQYANVAAAQRSTGDELRKLLKRERRLLEDLQEARDSEARTLQRFARVQAKLQRRAAKVARLEYQLRELREELGNWQQVEAPGEQGANGHAVVADNRQPELFSTVDIHSTEEAADTEVSATLSETVDAVDAEVPSVEVSASTDERDEFEPETHMTPVVFIESASETPFAIEAQAVGSLLVDLPEPPLSDEPSIVDEGPTMPVEPAAAPDERANFIEPASSEQAGEVEDGGVSIQEAEVAPVAEAEPIAPVFVSPVGEITPESPSDEIAPAVESQPVEMASPAAQEETAPVLESQPVEDTPVVAPGEVASSGDVAVSLSESAREDAPAYSREAEVTAPQPVAEMDTMQRLMQVREMWREAEYAAQRARSHAHELATSISTLAQAGLSETSMEELLRKQSEANKTLVEAQKRARAAYEALVQAEEAARAARPAAANGFDAHSDEVLETTVHTPAFEL